MWDKRYYKLNHVAPLRLVNIPVRHCVLSSTYILLLLLLLIGDYCLFSFGSFYTLFDASVVVVVHSDTFDCAFDLELKIMIREFLNAIGMLL